MKNANTPAFLTVVIAAIGATLLLSCGPKPESGVIRGPADDVTTKPVTEPTPQTAEEIIAASQLPGELKTALDIDPLGTEIHRLKNGLTVYISTDRTKPEFDAWIAVRAGSRNDPAESTGLAHYLEHMLFKGSSKLATIDFAKEKVHLDQTARLYDELRDAKTEAERQRILAAIDAETQKAAKFAVPNEFDQLYASIGISGVNAFTSNDQTVYISRVPSNRFDAWAKVEGDRFVDPQYRLFYPELEAVYEEKNRSLDSPNSRMFQALTKMIYPNHPYGTQPTIGLADHLKTPAYADMVAYYNRWYVPNNMAIVLAGDIDAARALPVLEREFARLTPKPLSYNAEARPSGDLAVAVGRRETQITAPGQNSVYLAWRAPVPTDPAAEIFEVLDLLMDNATTGLLNTELVLSQKLPSAGSFVSSSKEASFYLIYGTAKTGQSHADVEALLLGTVQKLKSGEFSQADIDAAVVNIEISEKRQLESNQARVSQMATAFINGQPWPANVAKLARLRAVKKADVIEAAKLLGENMSVVKRVGGKFAPPKIEKPKITPVAIDTSKASPFAAEIKAMKSTALEPQFLVKGKDYREFKLPAGELLTAHNDKNDLFTLSYEWETGLFQDSLLCVAFDALEKSGTKAADAVTLRKKLYAIGTDISFGCGNNSASISVSGIDRNLEASVTILREWLANSSIAAATVAKLVENRISERKDSLEEPRFVSGALQSFATVEKRSPYFTGPSNRTLTSLGKRKRSGTELASKVKGLLGKKHRTTYVGPRKPTSGAELTNAIGLGSRHRSLRKRPAVRYRSARKTVIYFAHKTAAQAQVSVLWAKKPLAIKQRPFATMFSEYIGGGLGALIAQEIREARGLAYSAGGRFTRGSRPSDAAALYAALGTQADKTTEAVSALIALLRDHKVDPVRFAVAKNAIIESYRSTRPDPRSTLGVVQSWKELGLSEDPRPTYYERTLAMKAEELAAFSKGVAAGPMIIAITGDRSRIDMKALAAMGKVVTVEPAALVSW